MEFRHVIGNGTKVLVTGGTGTLGSALIPNLLRAGAQVRVLSRDEAKQGAARVTWPDVDWRLGDVRDFRACQDAVRGVEVVIHAASLKYVDVSERQPSEYVLTNVIGTMNMIQAVMSNGGVRQVIGISTDKACAPFNTYGLTKGLLEKLFVEAHQNRGGVPTQFTVCRYGNVIGSRGSVILKWQELIRAGRPIQVTDPSMTRFFFTIDDAIDLIISAVGLFSSGAGVILARAMPACTLGDLAAVMSNHGELLIVGRRPGEKPHEDLLSEHEMSRVWKLDEKHFTYNPLEKPLTDWEKLPPYTSDTARRLTVAELKEMTKPWR